MAKNVDKHNLSRIAIVNEDLCRPTKCSLECKRACPVNRIGKVCIKIEKHSVIDEKLCIGCGACKNVCPFKAISIVNLPKELEKECSHRYDQNSFKLHRLPIPKLGKVVGLVGTNGIGKSTALQILSGVLKPNLGNLEREQTWHDILTHYRGSELQGYFSRVLEVKNNVSTKKQNVYDCIGWMQKKFGENVTVEEALTKMDQTNSMEYYTNAFTLRNILMRKIKDLSGGEIQRFYIAITCMQSANVYIFDEPTSYLDVRQRLAAAREIHAKSEGSKYVLVVEHDLAVLDLMSDHGCVMYGVSGAYGVITAPQSIKASINIFLDGYIPTDNMRFRDQPLKFTIQEVEDESNTKVRRSKITYPAVTKTFDNFKLVINEGMFCTSQIIGFMGENGMGKTTFVNLIAGILENDQKNPFLSHSISLKPQKIKPKYKCTVKTLFNSKIRGAFMDHEFQTDVIKPLAIDYLLDQELENLSGGEAQRVAIVLCLGKEADLYLLDEPSAFLDSEQRLNMAKVIRKFIYSKKKTAFVVEHDLIVATYISDRVVVFEGTPGVSSICTPPMDLKSGMNIFLKNLDITFRRDPDNHRPRVNKPDSIKDREQKASNNYFFS